MCVGDPRAATLCISCLFKLGKQMRQIGRWREKCLSDIITVENRRFLITLERNGRRPTRNCFIMLYLSRFQANGTRSISEQVSHLVILFIASTRSLSPPCQTTHLLTNINMIPLAAALVGEGEGAMKYRYMQSHNGRPCMYLSSLI